METYYILVHRYRKWFFRRPHCQSFIVKKETTFEEASQLIWQFRIDHPKFDFIWCGTAVPTHCVCGGEL